MSASTRTSPRTPSSAASPARPPAPRQLPALLLLLLLLLVPFAPGPALAAPGPAAQATAVAEPAVSETPASDVALREELDSIFAAAWPADEPGGAVLVKRGDEVLLRKGYGMADLELGVPVAPDMVFRLGSITKQFTGVAVLMLAAEGKVDLQAPVSAYLPDYPGPGAEVTVHQLLTHTGGIPSYTSDPAYRAGMREDRTVEEMIATWEDQPLDFQPGTGWSYSNSGYFLLGAVIEAVSGQTYEDFVETRIFEPLGMHHSHYGGAEKIVPRRVSGYDRAEDGEGYRNTPYLSMTQPYSAGSLLSNVDDLARWGEALFQGEELLSAEWRERLLAPARLDDGRVTGYAYGLGVEEYAGHRVVRHGGGINGFSTWLGFVPEERLTVAVLSNNTGLPPGPARLGQRALASALGQPLDDTPVELAPEVLAEYEGVYLLETGSGDSGAGPEVTRVIRREGATVTSQRSGGSRLPLVFTARDEFRFPDSFTHGRFERDPEGRVTGVWISPQGGAEERFVRTARPVPTRTAIEIDDPALLDALVGRYEIQPGFVIEVRRQGDGLETQATGQPTFEIFPETPTRWFLTEVDAVIEFQGTEDGQADGILLHQGGQEIPARRIER